MYSYEGGPVDLTSFDTKKEKPKSLAEKNLKKRTVDDFTYTDCELNRDDE